MAKQRSLIFRRTPEGKLPEPSAVRIDGYRVEALLGRGILTATYRAVLESHQQTVALKVLLPWYSEQELIVQRFFQGANAARRVTHDRLLPCYDVGQSNGWVYLACELVEGRTLGDLMAEGPIPHERLVALAWQAAAALEALHAAELMHGNLRPDTILVDADDNVRVGDAGLPMPPFDEAAAHSRYLAPECLQEGEGTLLDGRADIYALGILCAEASAGSPAWAAVTHRQILERQAAGGSVLDLLPPGSVTADLAVIIQRACAGNPADRYPHAWQLREDLERVHYHFAPIHAAPFDAATATATRAEAVRSDRAPAPTTTAAKPPRSRAPLVAAAAAALLLLVGAVWWLGSAPTAAPATAPAAPSAATAAPPAAAAPPAIPKPSWASEAGQDATGRWAALTVNGISYRFRLIPAGSYWMGSPADDPDRVADEDHHLVTLTREFWLGETEVPQAFWQAVMGAPSRSYFTGDDLPVEKVSWNGVQEFLARLGTLTRAPFRLPTEAEWEYACRANDTVRGVPTTEVAWTAAANLDGTQPVGRLKPNAFGLFDMQGNVMEWVEDAYGRYGREPQTDPLQRQGTHRVARGGAWNLKPAAARPQARARALPVAELFYLGFRIAITE